MMVKDYHSVYDLNYHLILVTKYRRKVLNDIISSELKEMFNRIGEKYGIECVAFNHDIDHIHVLFRAKPATNLSKFLNAYKSATSRIIKRKYPEAREKLWEEKFWSHSFYLTTAGSVTVDILKDYVKSQGVDNR